MYAKYIKQEYADLNGTGHTQAYYKMLTTPMDYEGFVELCCREGVMPGVFSFPGIMAEETCIAVCWVCGVKVARTCLRLF